MTFLKAPMRDKPSRIILLDFLHPHYYLTLMNVRLKKLIGSVLIVVIAMLYALLATTIASAKLADANGWIHLAYFLVTGVLWIVPAMFIISWMMRPPKDKADQR